MIDHVREALEELMAVKALKKQAERLRREGMARNAETLDGEYERRKPLAWAAAKAALAAPTAEPTTSYVQPVPDKCDRITWRGQDDGCRGTMDRWEQALTAPKPASGVIGDERMEKLQRATEALRVERDDARADYMRLLREKQEGLFAVAAERARSERSGSAG